MTERDPKFARAQPPNPPTQPAEKPFDPGHLGRHTMPIELRLELMTAELPRLAEDELYQSPRSAPPAVPPVSPNAGSAVAKPPRQRSKTRRRIGVSLLVGVGLLAAMIGVVLLRAPHWGPQRLSPTSAILRASPVHSPAATGSGALTPPVATAVQGAPR